VRRPDAREQPGSDQHEHYEQPEHDAERQSLLRWTRRYRRGEEVLLLRGYGVACRHVGILRRAGTRSIEARLRLWRRAHRFADRREQLGPPERFGENAGIAGLLRRQSFDGLGITCDKHDRQVGAGSMQLP